MSYRSTVTLAIVLILAVSAAGCGTQVQYLATNPPPHAMTPLAAESVHVYTAGAPDRAFYEVGILTARQSSDFSADEMPQIIQEMRRVAGEQGCEGIIITESADQVVPTGDTNNPGVTTLEGYRAACIVYAEEETEEGGSDSDTSTPPSDTPAQ
jgi:hypothetical protein